MPADDRHLSRIALLIEYNGSRFCGSQYQAGVRTVQGELEAALGILARQPVTAIFAGRTDSGVHASGQVVHCDWPYPEPDLWRLAWAINGIVKDDLCVVKAQRVPSSFHARFSATARRYVYRIVNRPQRSALLRSSHYFMPLQLSLDSMTAALSCLCGSHDFAAFKSKSSDTVTSVCRVSQAELLNLGEGLLEFWIGANHFVYNMVRIIVGTLIEIGLGKREPESIACALSSGNRDQAGPTAPAWGLCLNSVQYPDAYQLFASEREENHLVRGPEI